MIEELKEVAVARNIDFYTSKLFKNIYECKHVMIG